MRHRLKETLILTIAYILLVTVWNSISTILLGSMGTEQFIPNDSIAIVSSTEAFFIGIVSPILTFIYTISLFLIWKETLFNWFKNITALSIIGILLLSFNYHDSYAYFSTTERTEAYTILPNESAFWIPDTGDSLSNQGGFDSEEFLNSNKIAARRFIVKHAKLTNSGGWGGFDSYVPVGRLIIVSRKPYSREWVKSSVKGTSSTDESIVCQSKEGINVTVGISVAASITPNNAAKYLYWFGVQEPKGERTDPEVIFTSVFYGRTLADVMDDIGRKQIQTTLCGQMTTKSLDEINANADEIMRITQDSASKFFLSKGITLEFIGWADTFTFDNKIQEAINDRYIAQTLTQYSSALYALNQLRVQEGLAAGLRDKGLPYIIQGNLLEGIMGLVKPNAQQTQVPAPFKK